jgi:hypothetical protein
MYVFSLSYTRNGLTLIKDSPRILPLDVAPLDLGSAVLSALQEYETDAPEETQYARYLQRVLRKLGFSGQLQFHRGTKHVGVKVIDGGARVIPTKPYGRGSYLGLYERDSPGGGVARCSLEPSLLGETVVGCLNISVPHAG